MHRRGHDGALLSAGVCRGIGLAGLQREGLPSSQKLKVTQRRRPSSPPDDKSRLVGFGPWARRNRRVCRSTVERQTEAARSYWSSYSIIQTSASIPSLSTHTRHTHTPLISDMQADMPFKGRASGADERTMCTAATAAAMLQGATGENKGNPTRPCLFQFIALLSPGLRAPIARAGMEMNMRVKTFGEEPGEPR